MFVPTNHAGGKKRRRPLRQTSNIMDNSNKEQREEYQNDGERLLEDESDEEDLQSSLLSKVHPEWHGLRAKRDLWLPTRRLIAVGVVSSICVAIITLLVGLTAGLASRKQNVENTPPLINKLEWWKTSVIYQCYPRSFQDSDGDGNGDLTGVRYRVPYFASLGIKALWLNPIFVSPQKDNGYDVANYTDVDPLFGTMEDLKLLLKDLHKSDIHLLLDFVPNHTSDEHPWFQESRRNRNNTKRHWYVWKDGKGDGKPPNNWVSVFGGSAWTYDNISHQYYLHQFSEFQPDLNYSNPDVQTAIEDVFRFWLELGVDGFRVDAVKHLLEDPDLCDEPINTHSSCHDCYDSLIHKLTTDYPGLHNIIKRWRKILDQYSHKQIRLMIGEAYDPIETVMKYYGENGDEFHFPFNFFLLSNSDWTGIRVSQIVNDWLDHMPHGAWPNWVLGNHDNHRIASKAGNYLARALNVLLLTLPGTPTTYYGEEIMMTDVNIPPSRKQDLYGDRDMERTPMQWNSGVNAGFTTGRPWLPLSDNYTQFNVDTENNTDSSMLQLYKVLLTLRSAYPALQFANFETVLSNDSLFVYRRYHNSSSVHFLIAINFCEQPVNLTIPLEHASKLKHPEIVLSSSNLSRMGAVDLNRVLLSKGEAIIIKEI